MNSDEVRILFDECIPGVRLRDALKTLEPIRLHGILVLHLFEIAPPGIRDEDWIPKLKEGRWTIISADSGKRPDGRRGQKPPLLCMEYGLTLICLGSKIHHRRAEDKIKAIISVWDEILAIALDPSMNSKRYTLEPLDPENLEIGRLVERRVTKPPERP